MLDGILNHSGLAIGDNKAETLEGRVVKFSDEIFQSMTELRRFMFKNIYLGDILKVERKKAKFILNNLLQYYMDNPREMPDVYIEIMNKEGKERAIADYISGMTDDYCLNKFNSIYIPKVVIY